MTRFTFGVSASSFAANTAVKQNALLGVDIRPQAAKVVLDSFYIDNELIGYNSIQQAVRLRKELQNLFALTGFELHKWKTSEPGIAQHSPSRLSDQKCLKKITFTYVFTKVLGVEGDPNSDLFWPMISSPSPVGTLTKRVLLLHIAHF